MERYFNEAIIGNKNILATFSGKGEMLRLYYPMRDNRQYLNYFHTGVKINDSDIIYLHNDINNLYKQYYDTDTNILNTEITNTYFNLKILQTDFAILKDDVIIRKYLLINESNIDLDINFLVHTELLSDENEFVGAKKVDGGMIQYAHSFSISTFSKKDLLSHQINDTNTNIQSGIIKDKDYIGMSKDSSISFDIGKIKPNEKKTIEICVMINDNTQM